MSVCKFTLFLSLCLFVCLETTGIGKTPDVFEELVPQNHANYDERSGDHTGAFAYNPVNGRFYVSTYEEGAGIRCFMPGEAEEPNYPEPYKPNNILKDEKGVSWLCASSSTLATVIGSPDIEEGLYNPVSYFIIHGMVLNPKPVTVNGTNYGVGELAILCDGGEAEKSSYTKRILSWDLREVGSPAGCVEGEDPNLWDPSSVFYNPDNLPDKANAYFDVDVLDIEKFGQQFGYGCTNWNDTFDSLVTLQDMADAIGLGNVPATNYDRAGDKRACFSSDGKTLFWGSKDSREGTCYVNPKTHVRVCLGDRKFSGIWSYGLETGELRRIFDDTSSSRYTITSSEMAVVPVGVRNLSGLPYDDSVDQLLFDGSEASGNLSGVNCMMVDGTNEPPIYPVVSGTDFLDFAEIDVYSLEYYGIDLNEPNSYPSDEFDPESFDLEDYVNIDKWPKVWSITTDDQGNVYFYMRKPNSVYMYDTKGRMVCIENMVQDIAINYEKGIDSFYSENLRLENRKVEYKPEVGDKYEIVQLMYNANGLNSIYGLNVFKPCDFDRDGIITEADLEFFETQLNRTKADDIPFIEDEGYHDYLKADLNGSGRTCKVLMESECLPDRTEFELGNASVTEKDVEVLYDFIIPGNLNLDDRVDMADFSGFAKNYLTEDMAGWSEGDFDFDDDVDLDDLMWMADSWMMYDD